MKKRAIVLLSALIPALFTIVVAGQTPASAVACWTTFSPTNPNGAAMTQYYRNCSNTDVWVTPSYKSSSGSIGVFSNRCVRVLAQATYSWYFSGTYPGAQYSTANCAATGPSYDSVTSWTGTCYTDFTPDSPQGGAMTASYTNCEGYPVVVTTAWTLNGNFYTPLMCQVVDYHNKAVWYYSSTERYAIYTTAYCDEG